MNSLTLRIYLSVLAALTLLGLVTGWVVERELSEQRSRIETLSNERWSNIVALIQETLPPAHASREEQAAVLRDWTRRLRMPMALSDAQGQPLASTPAYERLKEKFPAGAEIAVKLDDGRTLHLVRLQASRNKGSTWSWLAPTAITGEENKFRPGKLNIMVWLTLLFAAVAAAAWPVSRALTRRLKTLQAGVQAFGSGQLQARVEVQGRDEVAALARSFNQAAERIGALLESHKTLLANASHELRSPLARLKMALAMLDEAEGERRASLQREIQRNISELDALVEEVLLSSRLEAQADTNTALPLDLLGLCAEEAAALQVPLEGEAMEVCGEERLLRRAVRNLLENARRYGEGAAQMRLVRVAGHCQVRVEDRGPGVPNENKARIFEPFFRLPGHAEVAGGVGLGLSLVRQIAQRHGGRVWCEDRVGGGSCFVLELPTQTSGQP